MEALKRIQQQLKAPKGQYNAFGKYSYRSCEDILEAAKPLLGDAVLLLTDEIVEIGGRVYVKATARLSDGGKSPSDVVATAYAREPMDKKGMDASQITGATSSYARKYALNGLFLIDDCKDADHHDNRQEGQKKPAKKVPAVPTTEEVSTAFWEFISANKAPKDDVKTYLAENADNGDTHKLMIRALANQHGFLKAFSAWFDKRYPEPPPPD